jgi:hypothetical protein
MAVPAALRRWWRRSLVAVATFCTSGDAGQATTEYALVLLGAALIALLLVAWATTGGGGGKIGGLLDRVFRSISDKVA